MASTTTTRAVSSAARRQTTTTRPVARVRPTSTTVAVTTTAPACHPSYTPCLAPTGDWDCGGGGGGEANGPNFVQGTVEVHGPDDYGLDADGDNIGCNPPPTTTSTPPTSTTTPLVPQA
jgi:hypothetical protein